MIPYGGDRGSRVRTAGPASSFPPWSLDQQTHSPFLGPSERSQKFRRLINSGSWAAGMDERK